MVSMSALQKMYIHSVRTCYQDFCPGTIDRERMIEFFSGEGVCKTGKRAIVLFRKTFHPSASEIVVKTIMDFLKQYGLRKE
ncbi:hypothetical protein ABH19_04520 [Leptospirillum sp. Group II 'CF-1']|nr:hypothetical protein ABH19_04520 [Leptospirillum sp. Group II 'CF-1']